MRRTSLAILVALIAAIVSAPPAGAASGSDLPAVAALSALWSKVFQTPSSRNPFGSGGVDYSCLTLAPGVVAPFGAGPVPGCTVRRGTLLVVTPWTFECSTFEGTTVPQLPRCAEDFDAGLVTSVSVDGRPVATREVRTIPIPIVLPTDNIFGEPAGSTGLSVGDGWISLLRLTAGRHEIHLTATGPQVSVDTTTVITVRG
jgi:hypothetical protein